MRTERAADKNLDIAIRSLAEVTSHPEFTNMIKEIEAKPPSDRMRFAATVATPMELRRRGIPLPDGFRITTHIFEAPGASTLEMMKVDEETFGTSEKIVDDDTVVVHPPTNVRPPVTVCASLGFIACASVGFTI